MNQKKVKNIIEKMTLEEKASFLSGHDFWHTKAFEHLGIPASQVADGPHGLRLQEGAQDHLGQNKSKEMVSFPTGATVASSFDRSLIYEMGETLGKEAQAEGVSVLLGPSINIKRSPLGGRNFEYLSEDPLLTTQMAESYIQGVQSQNVGASVKHFVANNQETRRNTVSAEIDERALREIYLAAFEGAIKNAKPWSVMSSYNRLNGTYVGERKDILTDILREEWGFDGYVVSDWGGVDDRVRQLEAGLDLEMPGPSAENDSFIVSAVESGTLDENVVDKACERILNIIFRFEENRKKSNINLEEDHKLAQKIAEESMVLLKNNDSILPLSKTDKIAYVGTYAMSPRFQGGGSSKVTTSNVVSALENSEKHADVKFAKGFDDSTEEIDEKLKEEALNLASTTDVVVVFAGLPDKIESESFDRKDLNLPKNQNDLIEAISEVNENVIVVLHNGSPVEIPWENKVKGILEAYLGGEAVGSAVNNILFGIVNPSGRLAESFPLKLEHNPSYLNFPGEQDVVNYREGIFIGYRYYETKKIDVRYPFGYGLSYTEFSYENLVVDKEEYEDTDKVVVTLDVVNEGNRFGKEVIQLYVSPNNPSVIRPVRELKAFDKVALEPGERKTVSFELDKRAFAYWETKLQDWYVETDEYTIEIGKNAHDIIMSKTIKMNATRSIPKVFTFNSTLGDVMSDPKGRAIFEGFMMQAIEQDPEVANIEKSTQGDDVLTDEMMEATQRDLTLRGLVTFVPGLTREIFQPVLDALNS